METEVSTTTENHYSNGSAYVPDNTNLLQLKNAFAGLSQNVVDLVYWRDVRKSGVVFGSVMVVLLSLAYCSLISVVAYTALTILTAALGYRIYTTVMGMVQKTENKSHPFKELLETDITISSEKAHDMTDKTLGKVNCGLTTLRKLFLVEDIFNSLKFGIVLYIFTYIGSWFNGLTLVILGWIALFAVPKVYETYQEPIDHYLGIASTHFNDIMEKIRGVLPSGSKEGKKD